MGKKEIRVVHVPRWVTVLLLLLVSVAMAFAVEVLSGHAVRRQPSFRDILEAVRGHDASNTAVLATTAPAIADILFFVPWGFLAFLSFDRPERSRRAVYAITMGVGVAFALGLIAWQEMLPTGVIAWQDVLWSAAGCVAGAALGHARKRVRMRFE